MALIDIETALIQLDELKKRIKALEIDVDNHDDRILDLEAGI